MTYFNGRVSKYTWVVPIVVFSLSCSKDSDLLSEYVASDPAKISSVNKIVVDDSFRTSFNKSIILDVLSNDHLTQYSRVNIVETSEASNGRVVINEDNTLTYVPNTESEVAAEPNIESSEDWTDKDDEQESVVEETITEEVVEETSPEEPTELEDENETSGETTGDGSDSETSEERVSGETTEDEEPETVEDSFTYTTETETEDGTITQETGTVTVTVSDDEEVSEEETPPQGELGKNYGPLKAFPSAEGFGKNATGGRGGYVVPVTNLNNSGPGSLRDALKMTGARTIIFKVGGIIDCSSYLEIPYKSGNVTIAGQTAPGGGITIRGAELRISASNVIMRYIKIRPGSNVSGSNVNGIRLSSYNNNKIEDVIIDHCSVTWATDKVLIIGGIGGTSSVNNVTVQKSIIGENIQSGLGFLLWSRATNISVFKNLLIHDVERNIRSSKCTSTFEMINNLVYGHKYGTQPTHNNDFDIIGNVYRTSPNTSTRFETIRLEGSSDCGIGGTRAYINDNVLNGREVAISSNLRPYIESSKILNSGISTISSSSVQSTVLADVGASKYKDQVDERLINDVVNSTGKIKKSVSEAGGYPSIANGTPYSDSDKDGMSNEWEISMSLDPNDSNDGNKDRNGDGYTNLEDFLNEVDF